MLRLTVAQEEYLQIGDNIKVVFLGRNGNFYHVMIDAPKDVNIVRSSVLEKQATSEEELKQIPKFYAEPRSYRPRKAKQAEESMQTEHRQVRTEKEQSEAATATTKTTTAAKHPKTYTADGTARKRIYISSQSN